MNGQPNNNSNHEMNGQPNKNINHNGNRDVNDTASRRRVIPHDMRKENMHTPPTQSTDMHDGSTNSNSHKMKSGNVKQHSITKKSSDIQQDSRGNSMQHKMKSDSAYSHTKMQSEKHMGSDNSPSQNPNHNIQNRNSKDKMYLVPDSALKTKSHSK